MLNRNNYQGINEFIARCNDCGSSFYVHTPDNNLDNHKILAMRHSRIHNHECSVYGKTNHFESKHEVIATFDENSIA